MDVAILQLAVDADNTKDERIEHVKDALKGMEQEDRRPDLVLLPEIWGTGFFNFDSYESESEKTEGKTYSALALWAEIDLAEVDENRRTFPVLRDRVL